MLRKSLYAAGAALVLAVAGLVALRLGERPTLTPLALAEVVAEFNAAADGPRVLAMLSPT